MTQHRVVDIERTADHRVYCIAVAHESQMYVFRYAYDTVEQAEDVMENIESHFGLPMGIRTDLSANYWLYPLGAQLEFVKRTNSKVWYITQPEG